MDHFVNKPETYVRSVDIRRTYVEDIACYLALMTKQPYDYCKQYVASMVGPGGPMEMKDPEVLVLRRGANGDREKVLTTFGGFLQSVYSENQMLSPSMTAYVHPDKQKSILALYIDGNLQLRKEAKHEMFLAQMAGDDIKRKIQNSKQTTFKIKNNSLSGAHSSPYTILWNKSSHSTLTSTCRVAVSYGNTNNEKFLYGNRHYWCPDVARNNIVSIVNHTDLGKVKAAMDKYGLQAPSVELVMGILERSTENYWRSPDEMQRLQRLVEALDDTQRAAFAYVSDLYHLSLGNAEFVREFFKRLSNHNLEPITDLEEADKWTGKKVMDDNLLAFVGMLCSEELGGGTLTNVHGDNTNLKLRDVRPKDYGVFAATVRNIIQSLDYYEDFIRAFWVTPNLPASVFQAPSIIRRGAIASDTDSTIFTVQHWTIWYRGQLDFTKESEDIASTAVYLAGQLIRHVLATTSGAMGVAKQFVNKLSMKNEFYFKVFFLTSRAKHYYAYQAAQEGNVFKKLKKEIKGVALRNSNIPPSITKKSNALLTYVMDSVLRQELMDPRSLLRYVGKVEDSIRKEVYRGSYDLLATVGIKAPDAYKKGEDTPAYQHYLMWEEVFATTYGHAPPPPYGAVKVPVKLEKKIEMKEWLDNMEDQVIADKLRAWNATTKGTMAVMYLPEQVLGTTGIPKEIINAVDIRPLIAQMMEAFYLILESVGLFMKNQDNTRLVSDEAWLLREDWPLPELDIDHLG